MKSDLCKLTRNTVSLKNILQESEKAAAVGIMSKIKIAATFMMIDYEKTFQAGSSFYSYGLGGNLDLQCPIWTLTNYRQNVSKEKDEKWDELEKSIIANIADDVSVGLQGSKVEITVKKTF